LKIKFGKKDIVCGHLNVSIRDHDGNDLPIERGKKGMG